MRARLALLVLAGSAALGGCAYGYGSGGYGPYGGMSVGVGYGSGYYDGYGGYGYGGYGGYGSYYNSGYYGGYGDPYFGWYDGFYYPGTGIYVYDRDRHRHRWSDSQRRHWEDRRNHAHRDGTGNLSPVWSGLDQQQQTVRVRSSDDNRAIQRMPVERTRERTVERRTTITARQNNSRGDRSDHGGRNRHQPD